LIAELCRGQDILLDIQLTPWNGVLEKLIVSQVVKKFFYCYANQELMTMLTGASHRNLCRASWIQSTL